MFFKKIRPSRKISHRARISLLTAGFTGVLLLVVFIAAGYEFYQTELDSANAVLAPAILEASSDYNQSRLDPYLNEILAANPEVSLAVFSNAGYRISQRGSLEIPADAEAGMEEISGVPAVIMVRKFPKMEMKVVGAVGWRSRQRAITNFYTSMAILWPSLIFLVAATTWFAARSTFEPLERLAKQAEALSTANLHARLNPEDGEYGEFANRLNRFLDRLERSVRREERFVSDAAHELRTPLTVMKGRLETTLLRERTDDMYRDTLKEVLSETERLAGLVEVLLLSATLLQGQVSSLDIQEQLERAHARWVDRYEERSVWLELDSEICFAKIKPREFEAIIDNLLSNAFKASPPNSSCLLKCQATEKGSRVEVKDSGPGVPVSEAESIFERFTRLDEGRTRDVGGFGIGLSVCRRIVEGRGGTVQLIPSDKGAHFIVELPN